MGIVMEVSAFFFFQAEDGIRDYKVTGVQTCALPICVGGRRFSASCRRVSRASSEAERSAMGGQLFQNAMPSSVAWPAPGSLLVDHHQLALHLADRKSTRLNSSHLVISYAVFCLKKKK